MQGNTPRGEIPTGDPRGARTPRHPVAQAPAGEGEEGRGSQPADTTTITFLKAEGETQQTACKHPAPARSAGLEAAAAGTSGAGLATEAASSRARQERQALPSQLAGMLPSALVPHCTGCFKCQSAAFQPPASPGSPILRARGCISLYFCSEPGGSWPGRVTVRARHSLYLTPANKENPCHQDKERVAGLSGAGKAFITGVSGETTLRHEGRGRKGKKVLLHTNAYTGGKGR